MVCLIPKAKLLSLTWYTTIKYKKNLYLRYILIAITCIWTGPGAAPSNIYASTKGITSLTISWDALNVFTKNGDVKGYK